MPGTYHARAHATGEPSEQRRRNDGARSATRGRHGHPAATYGKEWSTETRYLHSATRPAGPTYGYSRSRALDSAIREGRLHGVRWDSLQQVPWTRRLYRACASCPQTWRQLYYENKRSLGLKYDLVNARDLAGVGFWRIGYEGDRPGLYQLLRDKFQPG